MTISGRLTRDPETRITQSGMAVVSFSVAVNERKKDANGEWKDFPNYFDCTMFGKYAESVSKSLYKGVPVTVDGRLKQQTWEKDGQRRSKVEIIANELVLPPRQNTAPESARTHDNGGFSSAGLDFQPVDEDIPF